MTKWHHLTISLLILPIQMSFGQPLSYSTDFIQGEGDVKGIRAALQYHTKALRNRTEHWNMFVEISANVWEYGAQNQRDVNVAFSLSPVFTYPISSIENIPIYVELGIGISLLTDTTFAGKDVSTHLQFEDRLGLIFPLNAEGNHHISVRYLHYSNAGIRKPNPGLDFFSISYMRYF